MISVMIPNDVDEIKRMSTIQILNHLPKQSASLNPFDDPDHSVLVSTDVVLTPSPIKLPSPASSTVSSI
jgi:hypothetical protein